MPDLKDIKLVMANVRLTFVDWTSLDVNAL